MNHSIIGHIGGFFYSTHFLKIDFKAAFLNIYISDVYKPFYFHIASISFQAEMYCKFLFYFKKGFLFIQNVCTVPAWL